MPPTAHVNKKVETDTSNTHTTQRNTSSVRRQQFQARMSSLNIPLNGTPHSINQVVQRVEAGGQHPIQRREDFNYLQRTIGNQAVIQLLDRMKVAETADIHKTAAAGVQGTGSPLPHLDEIQQSFGQHDIRGVQAFTGTKAATASKAIGAQAYTTGNKIAFDSPSPDLHTTAHEATHILQQRNGVQLNGGVGKVGDSYERHADAVADKVVKGQSAERLINRQLDVQTKQTSSDGQKKSNGKKGLGLVDRRGKSDLEGIRKHINVNQGGIIQRKVGFELEVPVPVSNVVEYNAKLGKLKGNPNVELKVDHSPTVKGFHLNDKKTSVIEFVAGVYDEAKPNEGALVKTDLDAIATSVKAMKTEIKKKYDSKIIMPSFKRSPSGGANSEVLLDTWATKKGTKIGGTNTIDVEKADIFGVPQVTMGVDLNKASEMLTEITGRSKDYGRTGIATEKATLTEVTIKAIELAGSAYDKIAIANAPLNADSKKRLVGLLAIIYQGALGYIWLSDFIKLGKNLFILLPKTPLSNVVKSLLLPPEILLVGTDSVIKIVNDELSSVVGFRNEVVGTKAFNISTAIQLILKGTSDPMYENAGITTEINIDESAVGPSVDPDDIARKKGVSLEARHLKRIDNANFGTWGKDIFEKIQDINKP